MFFLIVVMSTIVFVQKNALATFVNVKNSTNKQLATTNIAEH